MFSPASTVYNAISVRSRASLTERSDASSPNVADGGVHNVERDHV